MNVTGSHGHDLFSVSPQHSRVYLPEALVLHDNEYNVMKQEEEHDAIEAKKLGISLDEYRHQIEYVAQAAENNERNIAKRLKEGKRKEQTLEEETTFGAGESNIGATLPPDQIEDFMNNEAIVRKQHEILAQAQSVRSEAEQQELEYEVIEHGLRERDSDYSFIEVYHYSPSLSTQGQKSAASHQEVSSQYPVKSSHSNIATQDNRYNRYNSHPGSSSSTPQQPRANPSPSISHYQFAIGSMVVVRNACGPPMYGVVKWLGQLPGFSGEYAGVELVSNII